MWNAPPNRHKSRGFLSHLGPKILHTRDHQAHLSITRACGSFLLINSPNTFLLETLAYCGQDLFSASLQHWDHTQPPGDRRMAW